MQAKEIIRTHPDVKGNINKALIRCIEECYACAQACTACADACLAAQGVQELRQCIRLNLDSVDSCLTTGAMSSRRSGSREQTLRQMIEACSTACRICAEECERHASKHEHCRICAESCRHCDRTCNDAVKSVTP